MLVHDFLENYARNTPQAICVSLDGASVNFEDMNRQTNQLANAMLQLGTSKGDRVAVLGENSIEHFQMILAASKIGAVSVPLNYRLATAELAYILNDSSTRLLLVLPDMESSIDELTTLLSDDTKISSNTGAETLPWNDWWQSFPTDAPNIELQANDAFIQLYTSGTTGNPKGVVSSHHNILSLSVMNATAAPHRANPGSAGIICAPLFHIGGTGSLVMGIYAGQHTLLHRTFDPTQVVNDMETYPVAGVFLVPAMIMAMLQITGIEQRDFSKLKQVLYGASPISDTLLRQALGVFKCDFIQMYGMTETTGSVINLSAEDHRRALDGKPELLRSCGRPSVGVKVRVMDTEGNPVATDEIGEIWIKSDSNMLGYHNLPDATTSCLTDGWVHTGDAGYLDADGYLYLKDRIKDMVVSGGENIYPVEVENALAKHPAIADVAVIGVPDKKFGEALLTLAVLKPGANLALEEMIEFCRDKIAGYKIPRKLELIEELPRNPSGKILKKILREPYWQNVDRNIG